MSELSAVSPIRFFTTWSSKCQNTRKYPVRESSCDVYLLKNMRYSCAVAIAMGKCSVSFLRDIAMQIFNCGTMTCLPAQIIRCSMPSFVRNNPHAFHTGAKKKWTALLWRSVLRCQNSNRRRLLSNLPQSRYLGICVTSTLKAYGGTSISSSRYKSFHSLRTAL